ncbi:MAG: hypothetical protein JO032_04715 [Alphaproteobacteria bacterium]|nr:hypothetical protein [Alphaproteobacteria bacterium]MBV9552075.1 hypothetical protein [Alphaproteobacteria bacterium]
MSKLRAAFLTAAALAAATPATPSPSAADTLHRITHDPAWGCRDKGDLYNLLFLGISASFDTQLAAALADGRCIAFAPGERVSVIGDGTRGVVKVQRGLATTVSTSSAGYWTLARNID